MPNGWKTRSFESDKSIPDGWKSPEEEQSECCQETEGDPVIVAYDFVTMYPSLEAKAAAKDAHDAVLISPIEL